MHAPFIDQNGRGCKGGLGRRRKEADGRLNKNGEERTNAIRRASLSFLRPRYAHPPRAPFASPDSDAGNRALASLLVDGEQESEKRSVRSFPEQDKELLAREREGMAR